MQFGFWNSFLTNDSDIVVLVIFVIIQLYGEAKSLRYKLWGLFIGCITDEIRQVYVVINPNSIELLMAWNQQRCLKNVYRLPNFGGVECELK